jgi:hypothetical protein
LTSRLYRFLRIRRTSTIFWRKTFFNFGSTLRV